MTFTDDDLAFVKAFPHLATDFHVKHLLARLEAAEAVITSHFNDCLIEFHCLYDDELEIWRKAAGK